MVKKGSRLSVRCQSDLLGINRSMVYYRETQDQDTEHANLIAEAYSQYPIYGYRRIQAHLSQQGHQINKKRVQRLMREMSLKEIYPGPKTTVVNKEAKTYPYLLNGLIVSQPHQAWQVDITYLRTPHGFLYLTALIDLTTRYVVGWNLSNSLDTESGLRALENGVLDHKAPDIINSDQGCQFTSMDWEDALTSQGILISMCGAGRSNDNAYIERLWRTLKYEWTFIKGIRTVEEYKTTLPQFFDWYNNRRPHQALGYKTPQKVLVDCLDEYVDKAIAFSHISKKTKTDASDSLISD